MTTYSKATVLGRPLHPMLVGIPVTLYVATVVSFVVFAGRHDPRWFQVGLLVNLAAVLAALVTAIPGFIDFAYALPNGSAAKRTAGLHMAANLSALALFAANLAIHRAELIDAIDGRVARFAGLDPFLPLSIVAAGFGS